MNYLFSTVVVVPGLRGVELESPPQMSKHAPSSSASAFKLTQHSTVDDVWQLSPCIMPAAQFDMTHSPLVAESSTSSPAALQSASDGSEVSQPLEVPPLPVLPPLSCAVSAPGRELEL